MQRSVKGRMSSLSPEAFKYSQKIFWKAAAGVLEWIQSGEGTGTGWLFVCPQPEFSDTHSSASSPVVTTSRPLLRQVLQSGAAFSSATSTTPTQLFFDSASQLLSTYSVLGIQGSLKHHPCAQNPNQLSPSSYPQGC